MRNYGAAIACISMSIGALAWLIIGSFTNYAPTVTATEIQNHYISRIACNGGAVMVLQVVAILSILRKSVERD